MSKIRIAYLGAGFLAGIAYLLACGVGSNGGNGITQSIAATIGNAVDVVYDNATSKLTAINLQAAVDEIVTRIKNLEAGTSAPSIVGKWQLTSVYGITSVARCG